MNTQQQQKLEQRAIRFSIIGAAFFASVGIAYGLYSRSQSILFDGVYSSISLVMSLVTLWVSKLVVRPDDERFQFGYTHLEPLLNVIKALIIGATCVYAATEAVSSLLSGGRQVVLNAAITYAVLSMVGSLTVGSLIYHYAKKTGSELAAVDATDWLFDGVLSVGILLGFLIAAALQDGPYGHWVRYMDPAMVIMLVALFAPIPIRIFRQNIREVLYVAPEKKVQQAIRQRVESALREVGLSRCHIRMAKSGRELNLSVYVMVGTDFPIDSVQQLDAIRDRIAEKLEPMENQSRGIWLDIMFTADREWVFA